MSAMALPHTDKNTKTQNINTHSPPQGKALLYHIISVIKQQSHLWKIPGRGTAVVSGLAVVALVSVTLGRAGAFLVVRV